LKNGGANKNIIIYPFGEYGILTKKILNESFGIQEKYIVDNKLSEYNHAILNLDYFKDKDTSKYTVLLTNANYEVHEEVRQLLNKYFESENIIDIFPLEPIKDDKQKAENEILTKCGKYSYGPLCNHYFVESVGAFSSFAAGTDVVQNHATQYISTHPMLYADKRIDPIYSKNYEECKDRPWYFDAVQPKGKVNKVRRIKIGNDVWLGRNVIITNGSNIGNGVIAGAGAVITKDVPDYAVVVGVPARIVKYRYTREQIEALNKISWWDWSDEKIRQCYNDFYDGIDLFIEKHG
jgi:acetyltransferase-like isoleucine patch superfamily enzyme